MKLKDYFNKSALPIFGNEEVFSSAWDAISKAYGEKHRYYHTLEHLGKMASFLPVHQNRIEDINSFVLALFYHDIIYNPRAKNNEEKSAQFAKQLLENTSFMHVQKVEKHIMATKCHLPSKDPDTNILIDMDLAILGAERVEYEKYESNIRCEYKMYPNFLYDRGRQKVLKGFLKEPVFKTPYFKERFEKQAIDNISWAISKLS